MARAHDVAKSMHTKAITTTPARLRVESREGDERLGTMDTLPRSAKPIA